MIGLVGAGGHIGSYLMKNLQIASQGFDCNPRLGQMNVAPLCASDISTSALVAFPVILYLGGLTGRAACSRVTAEENNARNVVDVVSLSRRMLPNQTLIFASTASVLQGLQYGREDEHASEDVMDEYTLSMYRREQALIRESQEPMRPKLVGLRFGTLVGVSPGQRTDHAYPSLLRSAYIDGIISVSSPHAKRPFLWLRDLKRALHVISHSLSKLQKFQIFNLVSYHATIAGVAADISAEFNARIEWKSTGDVRRDNDVGFGMNNSLFSRKFSFSFEGTRHSIINEYAANAREAIVPKGAHMIIDKRHKMVRCPICGEYHPQDVFDIGTQPLANEFTPSEESSLALQRYSLNIVRCRNCNHMFMTKMIPRQRLFKNYLYRSGTSQTLKEHFEWLRDKVIRESGNVVGHVLDIASNDGSQLNAFKEKGWKTYGVDPATNLNEIAMSHGHRIYDGFWPDAWDKTVTLDAILAQNVLAHTPTPIAFLKGCADSMSAHTRLYVQTSQCDMHYTGQVDTVYHEHISFFTAMSFRQAAEMAGLVIVNFERVSIHGTSCLVTMMLPSVSNDKHAPALTEAIVTETKLGIADDAFYNRFASKVRGISHWLQSTIRMFSNKYRAPIASYGAAAKGIVMLNLLGLTRKNISTVIDDAKEKQSLFCPGTGIPVTNLSSVTDIYKVILILAWNFEAEIVKRIGQANLHPEWMMLPYPYPRILDVDGKEKFRYKQAITRPSRRERHYNLTIVTHFYNEEFMLPHWIRHHARLTNQVVLIDYCSTDRSVDIIRNQAPHTWQIVQGPCVFQADLVDKMVNTQERKFPNDWVLALTITEFLVTDDMDALLSASTKPMDIVPIPMVFAWGDDTEKYDPMKDLLLQRYHMVSPGEANRYVHRGRKHPHVYTIGRHSIQHMYRQYLRPKSANSVIVKFQFSPWPELMERKIQIGTRIPLSDRKQGRGIQHYKYTTNESMTEYRSNKLKQAKWLPATDSCMASIINAYPELMVPMMTRDS